VDRQHAFLSDLKGAAAKALGSIKPAEGMDAKTVSQLAAYDVYV
jgi:hypothetical protein